MKNNRGHGRLYLRIITRKFVEPVTRYLLISYFCNSHGNNVARGFFYSATRINSHKILCYEYIMLPSKFRLKIYSFLMEICKKRIQRILL